MLNLSNRRTRRELVGTEQLTNRAILIKVRNPDEIARGQGSMAAFAQTLAPATIEAKVLQIISEQLQTALAAQHVDAEVTVVSPIGLQTADDQAHIATDIGLAIGGIGLVALLWSVMSKKGGK